MTDTTTPLEAELTTLEEIQATVGPVSEATRNKARPALDRITRQFIAMSPFLCIGTGDSEGGFDVSPRGDPPGFVKVLDDRTIVIPERSGNRGIDTLRNILDSGSVGIIMFLPGVGEVLRINGTARIVGPTSPLLRDMEVRGTQPLSGIVVSIREVFFHCARALIRGRLWDAEAQVERSEFPTMGQIVREQLQLDEETALAIEDASRRGYGEDLYRDVAADL